MDIQDQTKTATPSEHESHGVHTCHRCGWPFPNPHPSPKHRRAHKKICGTIEGYTKLIDSGVVSDDEHHSDEDKEKTPSPEIEKRIIKESGSGAGGIEERSNRSEDDLFSDAVTEFSDSGISPGVEDRFISRGNSDKTLDGDSFQSFKDAENADTIKLLDTPIEVRQADDNLEAFETPDTHAKEADKSEENDINTLSDLAKAKIELSESDTKASDPLVEDGDGSHKDKFIDLVEPSTAVQTEPDSAKAVDVSSSHVDTFEVPDNKKQEAVYVLSVPSDIPLVDHSTSLMDDFKDHEAIYSNIPLILGTDGDKDTENRSMLDTFEIKTVEEKIQESQNSENGESSMESAISEHTNTDSSAFVPTIITEEVKVAGGQPSEMSKTIPESTDNLIEAEISPNKHSVVALGEMTEAAAAAAEGTSEEIKQEKFEPDHENGREVGKEADIDHSVSVLSKEDLASEKCSEACTREIVKEPQSGIEAEQKIVESVGADSKDSGNVGISQRSEKLILEEAEQSRNASGVVSEAVVDEGNGKLITSQDCGVDVSVGSSSRNSLEGNWGSVSVLSIASIDAEHAQSIDKSGIAADKSCLGKSDVLEDPSSVEPKEEIVNQKASEVNAVTVQNSQEARKSEVSRVVLLPSVTDVGNESEGRKRNEEAIAKVTNWSTGKHSATPLKNLVSEAKSPNSKQLSTLFQKDEIAEKTNEPGKSNLMSETPLANQELSPPKYIGKGKKVRKKVKGRASWVPFVCCSSVNVN